jgi:hypothetical protein
MYSPFNLSLTHLIDTLLDPLPIRLFSPNSIRRAKARGTIGLLSVADVSRYAYVSLFSCIYLSHVLA